MTIGAIVDRLYRTYLYPPDAQPARCFLDGALDSSATTFALDNFVLPEDEELMAVGVILEIGSELIQVITYDTLTTTATLVERGVDGTTAVAHDDNSAVVLSPAFSRLSVFEAIADNIITLYPKLYTVTTGSVVSIAGGISAMDDPLAVEVVEAWPDGFSSTTEVDARIVDYHAAAGGRALLTNLRSGHVWVRYRRRFGDVSQETTGEDTTLDKLGMEQRWVNIVMAGAAADTFAGRDLSAVNTRWVGAVLEAAEGIPVGTRSQLARQLVQYRDHLLTQAQKEMRAEYKSKVHMRSATQVRTRSAFG